MCPSSPALILANVVALPTLNRWPTYHRLAGIASFIRVMAMWVFIGRGGCMVVDCCSRFRLS